MDYKKYQHIEKLGTSEVEGILNGKVHLSYKIDGTNACVYIRNNELVFGSRNRELSIDFDNCKFVENMLKDEHTINALKTYLSRHPNHIVYGEWLVPVTIKRYKKNSWYKFYIFDVFDCDCLSYINIKNYIDEIKELELLYIPEIAVLTNPSEEEIKAYLDKTGDFLLDNELGEGIVIKNYEYRNKYGRQTWAKILTEDFSNHKISSRMRASESKEADPIEYKIITKYMTPEHILKKKQKLIEKYSGWESKRIFELLNRCFLEFYKDNWEIILNKLHYPTIDFKKLKKYSDEKVKEVAGL